MRKFLNTIELLIQKQWSKMIDKYKKLKQNESQITACFLYVVIMIVFLMLKLKWKRLMRKINAKVIKLCNLEAEWSFLLNLQIFIIELQYVTRALCVNDLADSVTVMYIRLPFFIRLIDSLVDRKLCGGVEKSNAMQLGLWGIFFIHRCTENSPRIRFGSMQMAL